MIVLVPYVTETVPLTHKLFYIKAEIHDTMALWISDETGFEEELYQSVRKSAGIYMYELPSNHMKRRSQTVALVRRRKNLK